MLVEYKGKWFNPYSVESIRASISGNTVIQDGLRKRQLYLYISISGNVQITIPIQIYCDNQEVLKYRDHEYIDNLAKKDLEELALFINKHCKGK